MPIDPDELKRLREAATPPVVVVSRLSNTDLWSIARAGGYAIAYTEHGSWGPNRNRENAELFAYLVNHAEEIEQRLRAADAVVEYYDLDRRINPRSKGGSLLEAYHQAKKAPDDAG